MIQRDEGIERGRERGGRERTSGGRERGEIDRETWSHSTEKLSQTLFIHLSVILSIFFSLCIHSISGALTVLLQCQQHSSDPTLA
jgi:hypothetical protein